MRQHVAAGQWQQRLAFFGRAVVDVKVKIIRLAQVMGNDDFLLQVEYGYAGAVECHPRLILPRLELVEHRRCHGIVLVKEPDKADWFTNAVRPEREL